MGRVVKVSVQNGQSAKGDLTMKTGKYKLRNRSSKVTGERIKVSQQTGILSIVDLKKEERRLCLRKPNPKKSKSIQLNHLPNEVLLMIVKKLAKPDLSNTALVCRRLRDLCNQSDVWNIKSIEIKRKNFREILQCERLKNVVKVTILGNFVDKEFLWWNPTYKPSKKLTACWNEPERLECYGLLLDLPSLKQVQGGLWQWLVLNRSFGRKLKKDRRQVWKKVDTMEIAPSHWPGFYFSGLMSFTNRMNNLTKLTLYDMNRSRKCSEASELSFAFWNVSGSRMMLMRLVEFRVDGIHLSGTQLQQLIDIFISSENIRKLGLPGARLRRRIPPEQILAVSKKLECIDLTSAKMDKSQLLLLRPEVKAGKVAGWRTRLHPLPGPQNNFLFLLNLNLNFLMDI